MKLIIIRHGETDWNKHNKIQGSQDIDINSNGEAQAEYISEILRLNYEIKKIYTSNLLRAKKTAKIINNKINVQIMEDPLLSEINLGEWEGLTWEDVEKCYPIEFSKWFHNRRYEQPPKGESYDSLAKRTLKSLYEIIKNNNTDDDILVVTHSANIMVLKSLLYETDFKAMTQYKEGNTAFTEFNEEQIKQILSLVSMLKIY